MKRRENQTSFTGGEVPKLIGRPDLRSYQNGAYDLENTIVRPQGGVDRRPGTVYVATAAGPGRLVAFEFNTEQVYLLLFTDSLMTVFRDGVQQTTVATPWTAAQVQAINWTQSADTLLVVHPDVEPQRITRTSHTSWTVSDWVWVEEEDDNNKVVRQSPHHKYADPEIVLRSSGSTGTNLLITAKDKAGGTATGFFMTAHVGTRFRIDGKELEITVVDSDNASTARARSIEVIPSNKDYGNWTEEAFSAVRGWPTSVCFHQDRLVLGGGRDAPDTLWLSKSGEYFNFDVGEADKGDAIEVTVAADEVNAIQQVYSGRHLQVFTSGAEWQVTGEPLSPDEIQVKRQTRHGTRYDRSVPVADIDGATVFVDAAQTSIREFLFADTEQAYQANDLTIVSKQVINAPVDMAYNRTSRLLYVVNGDGTMATLTNYRNEEVNAWTPQNTDGTILSVAAVGGITYLLVTRANGTFVEEFDATVALDSCLKGTSETPETGWSGLDHLEGETVTVLGDGTVLGAEVVSSGAVTIDVASSEVVIGLPYRHTIQPMPPAVYDGPESAIGTRIRPIAIELTFDGAHTLGIDWGGGLREPIVNPFATPTGAAPPLFAGALTVRAYGWRINNRQPLWKIQSSDPFPFGLVMANTEFASNT